MNFDVTGAVKVIMDLQSFDSGFTKREFVVTVQDGSYPQDLKFELIKERTSLIDAYQVGEEVKVSFNIRGNEYNGRYYVNLQAWRLEKGGAVAVAPPAMGQDSVPEPPPGFPSSADDDGSDLPF